MPNSWQYRYSVTILSNPEELGLLTNFDPPPPSGVARADAPPEPTAAESEEQKSGDNTGEAPTFSFSIRPLGRYAGGG